MTSSVTKKHQTKDIPSKVSFSGILGIIITLSLLTLTIAITYALQKDVDGHYVSVVVGTGITFFILTLFFCSNFYIISPNEYAVIVFFGKYKGTDSTNGLRWLPPFYTRYKDTYAIRNFESDKLKINDLNGNPIEFAAIVSYRIKSPAQAVFDVDADDFDNFIEKQSESALRATASKYPYDSSNDKDDDEEITLRGDSDEVSKLLHGKVQINLEDAGVDVLSVKISHLAYATEIAQAMLQRQQASALVSAKSALVKGSVGIIKEALTQIEKENLGSLKPEDKNQIIANMLLVLAGDSNAQPVINTHRNE